ncbi:MAG: oligosaccharide flippase family protein [Candidatus Omnitrophica bacterium]|nr:oligosaccharide flippase family protein [Candidatus Omnitrophota bacterium]
MQEYLKQPKKVSDKVIVNTFYNVLGRIWFVAIGVLLTPYIIGRVGVERYAVWALVGVITGYFGLLDFGVGSSFVKYISEFEAKKDYAAVNRLVNTGFAFYALFGLLVLALSFVCIGPLMEFLKIPPALRPEAKFVFLLGIAVFCGSDAMGPFLAVQSGMQRMDISNKIAMAMSTVTVAGTLFFLEQGFGLAGLILTNAIVFVLTAIVGIFAAHHLLPQLAFDPFSWDTATFKRIFSFGFKVQVTRISGTVTSQTDKILITYFLTIGLVTVYQLGSSVVSYAMAIPALLVSALVPAFSEIHARQEHKKLVEAYLQSTKYLSCITAPLFLFVATSAGRIMDIWMGQGFGQSAIIIQILCELFLLLIEYSCLCI